MHTTNGSSTFKLLGQADNQPLVARGENVALQIGRFAASSEGFELVIDVLTRGYAVKDVQFAFPMRPRNARGLDIELLKQGSGGSARSDPFPTVVIGGGGVDSLLFGRWVFVVWFPINLGSNAGGVSSGDRNELIISWPDLGIERTVFSLDTDELRNAALRSTDL